MNDLFAKDDSAQPRFEPRFEIVLQIRDGNGQPTGKTKSLKSDHANEISNFYDKNCIWEFDKKSGKMKVRNGGRKRRKSSPSKQAKVQQERLIDRLDREMGDVG